MVISGASIPAPPEIACANLGGQRGRIDRAGTPALGGRREMP
jgi:hypothetical protein